MTENTTITPVDRTGWPAGPWDGEPDIERLEVLGLPCLIVRQARMGHLCGYVAVPPGHPWHGVTDDGPFGDVPPEVHGGITYAARCAGDVCHVPKPGEPADVWWLGFDHAHLHLGDVSPAASDIYARALLFFRPLDINICPETYRTIDYVRDECRSLATQARRAQGWVTV